MSFFLLFNTVALFHPNGTIMRMICSASATSPPRPLVYMPAPGFHKQAIPGNNGLLPVSTNIKNVTLISDVLYCSAAINCRPLSSSLKPTCVALHLSHGHGAGGADWRWERMSNNRGRERMKRGISFKGLE